MNPAARAICLTAFVVFCASASTLLQSKRNANVANLEPSVGRLLSSDKCDPTDKYDWTYNYACSEEEDSQVPPDMWYTKYPDCGGSRQSPINLSLGDISPECSQATVTGPFDFTSGTCTYANLAADPSIKTWEIVFNAEGCGTPPSYVVNGKTYVLAQFHFHSVSEHTVGGGYYDAELHMVHANPEDDMDFMVLGVMLSVNSDFMENTEVSTYLDLLVEASEDYRKTDEEMEYVNPYKMLPADGTFFTYLGSLTNPPCSEVVTWIVFQQPILISPTELSTLRDGYAGADYTLADMGGNNARPVQELGERTVYQCSP